MAMSKNKKKNNQNCGKKRFQGHFRKFRNGTLTGHPQYVFGEDGKVYQIIGITTGAETNGVQNIPLDKNPEPGNDRQAYIRPKTGTVKKGVANSKLNGWKFAESDKQKVKKVIDGNKKKKPRK